MRWWRKVRRRVLWIVYLRRWRRFAVTWLHVQVGITKQLHGLNFFFEWFGSGSFPFIAFKSDASGAVCISSMVPVPYAASSDMMFIMFKFTC